METLAPKTIDDLPLFADGFGAFRKDRLGSLRRFALERAPLGRMRGLGSSVTIASSPETVHEVLVEKARCFEKSPVLRMSLYPLAGEGLFTSEGELWKRQRKLMAPIFQLSQIEHFAAQMTACAERAAGAWKDAETLDIARETTRIAMAVAGKTLFDVDMFGEADELGDALTVALQWTGEQATAMPMIVQARVRSLMMRLAGEAPPPLSAALNEGAARLLRPILWPGEKTRALRRALDMLEGRVLRMIESRRKSPGADDLLSRLLAARDDEDGAAMSDRQVRDEVLTLFVAGHETTATALAWSVMLLCQNPATYTRARDEALALPGSPGYRDLPRLSYCLRVFKEAMRLYPAVFAYGRQAITPVEIGGCAMPRGTIVIVSPFTMHRKPEIWPDPERFDPDRFLPEAEAARPRSSYFPFSLGPRTCIGNHFALMEGPLILATLLRHADFELCDPRGVEPDPQATLRPKGAILVRVKRRAGAGAN